MVNETIAENARVMDFNLESSKLAQVKSEKINLQRSSSGILNDAKEKLLNIKEDPFATTFNALLLPKSAENLSWKFFEQVSSLDYQLRSDEQTGVVSVYDCEVMTSPNSALTHDHIELNGHIGEDKNSKSNGFMPGATKKLSSQTSQSPDLIQQQTTRHATFQFTSPTATFKRKKQLHQQQQKQQQQQQQINNNYNSNNKNQLQTAYEHHCKTGGTNCIANQTNILKLSPHRHHQENTANHNTNNADNNVDDFYNVETTTMISNAGVIINSDNNRATTNKSTGIAGISTGTGTDKTHSFKTRTLPAVSVVRGAYAVEEDNNYKNDDDDEGNGNDDNNISKPIRKNYNSQGKIKSKSNINNNNNNSNKSNSRLRRKQRMGATLQHNSDSFVDGIEQHFSLIGWRKKCLYTLLVLLMLMVVINLMLTLWIMRVMEFSTDGMGLLKIVPGGIQLTGQAIIMDMLRASTIRSRHGQPIAIESSRNFSINTRDTNGMLENHLFLGHDKLECLSTGFRINDTAGRNLFSVNQNEVTIGAHALRIDGEGGAIFRESIQTPHVRAEPGRELRLESPTRQLEVTAARDINLQSRAGGIELSALEDVKLITLDGSLRLESTKILMPNLRTAQPPIPGIAQSREHLHRVFQLCACSNGKLFLAASHSICAGDDSTVCR